MGMDIYALPLHEESQERQGYERQFNAWVVKREKTRRRGDEKAEEAAQKKVEFYFGLMHSGRLGYFRVNYNPFSLSWWIEYNIEKEAKGDWGLAIFYDAVKGKAEPVIDDDGFRDQLLATSRRWYEKALGLKDKESVISEPEYDYSGDAPKQMGTKTHRLSPKETNGYIDW